MLREYGLLESAYDSGGLRALNEEVVERSAAPGPLYYVLADQTGKVIAGDYDALPRLPASGSEAEWIDFPATVSSDGEVATHQTRAHFGRLLNGPILLVARDQRESRAAASRMTKALTYAAGISVAFSILAGLVAAWLASRRVELLSETTRKVMAGDLTRRAKVEGWGDEFDLLAQNLNDMLARLEKQAHATRTAGESIAHDLRTPITRLRQRLDQALASRPDEEADREALQYARAETDRVLKTFNAVLQLSRLKSAETWRLSRLDIAPIVEEMAELYEPAADEAGLVMTRGRASPMWVLGDAHLISQALANLLDNAMKYTPKGGRVHLSCGQRPDGRLEIRVADSGPGIPAADRERVKQRFVRLEANLSSEGAGLGLALVDAVAELHGGAFLLEDGLASGAGFGTAAVVVLPALDGREGQRFR
ncbi:MAG: HAMP domain-containing sensor histidine kinase [Hyphomonadaceae bacterium]|nr:HAMP domain-containing sensor histidine kinase [Hyphomonadaceae bacterium]